MKKITRFASIGLCALMIASSLSLSSFAATSKVTGASKLVTESIKVDGKDTGATITQARLDKDTLYAASSYEGLLNIIEADPSAPLLSFETLNGGTYTYSTGTMGKESVEYNAEHKGETVLAAMNTDPWYLHHKDYTGDGKSDVGTDTPVKHVSVFRGVMVIDGELWATPQIADEGNMSCGTEAAVVASTQAAFAYTSDGKAFIGTPQFSISVTNDNNSDVSLVAQGINRLAAPNSIIIYNYRGGNESYAHSDAYEVYLECDSSANFKIGQDLKGTVTHVFASGDTSARPAITDKTVVISARGSKVGTLKDTFKVGDVATINPSVRRDSQNSSNRSLWNSVESATGGFWTICMDKVRKDNHAGDNTRYPCPIVGIKDDGTVLMITSTITEDGSRNAITMDKMYDLVIELGCKDALMFDGGGSCQLVTLEGDEYVRRCAVSDGQNQVRSVVNGLALVYHGEAKNTVKNMETEGINFLDGLGLADTGENEVVSGFVGSPSYSYYYVGSPTSICGKSYENVYGMRDPKFSTEWTAEQKQQSIQPATVDGSEITLIDGKTLTISGWAFANGSQKRILWSVDKENWYEVSGGSFSAADDEIVKLVSDNAWIKSIAKDHAVFTDVEANLEQYAGSSVSVHFAVTPGNDDKALHFLTIENIVVPVKPEGEEPTTGEDTTDEPTEVTTEVPTEDNTDVITDGTTTSAPDISEENTSNDQTDATEEKKGCGSAVSFGVASIALMGAAAVLYKKKKHFDE